MSLVDDFLGFAATAVGIVAMIPQIIVTYKRRTTTGLSMLSVMLNAIGTLFWLAYGLGNVVERWQVIVSAGVTILQTAVLIYIYYDIRGEEVVYTPQIPGSAPPGKLPVNAGTSDAPAGGPHARALAQTVLSDPVKMNIRVRL